MQVSDLVAYLGNEAVIPAESIKVKDAEGNLKTIASVSQVGAVDPIFPEGGSPAPAYLLIQLA